MATLKGAVSAQNALHASETEPRKLLKGKQMRVKFPINKKPLIGLHANFLLPKKDRNKKIELVARPALMSGHDHHWGLHDHVKSQLKVLASGVHPTVNASTPTRPG